MTIEMPNNFTDWVAAATEVKSELSAVGINVTLNEPQYAQYEKDIGAGSFDAAMGGFGGSGSPYIDFNNALNSKFATPLNTPTVNNFERFKSPQVDQALAQLAAARRQGRAEPGDVQARADHVHAGADRPHVLRRQLGPVLDEELHRMAVGRAIRTCCRPPTTTRCCRSSPTSRRPDHQPEPEGGDRDALSCSRRSDCSCSRCGPPSR